MSVTIVFAIIDFVLGIIVGCFAAMCYIGREDHNTALVKRYKPLLIVGVSLFIIFNVLRVVF